jgi:hypothetical protein
VSQPIRIQRKRTKGWKMPPNTVCVCRPGKWGNPFLASNAVEAGYKDGNAMAVHGFNRWLAGDPAYQCVPMDGIDPGRDFILTNVGNLRGKNLACWCPLDQPCHADVLLELANPKDTRA